MTFFEENRITKWLRPIDKEWLLKEKARIEKTRGWTCAIDEKYMPLLDCTKSALFKVSKVEDESSNFSQ